MQTEAVSDRAQHILKILIERYIRDGQPVGSKTLAEDCQLRLSSATVRNVMAELEDLGFLHSPHTSAGRVPTPRGYRLFVDSLLTTRPLDASAVEKYQAALGTPSSTNELLSNASNMLSALTKLAGLVTLPKRKLQILRHVEFIALSENRVLVVLVLNDSEVQNRIIELKRVYKKSELEQAGNYLTENFAGKDLSSIQQYLLKALAEDKAHMDSVMQQIIDVAADAFAETSSKDDYIVSGTSNLFDAVDEAGVDNLKNLFNAFAQKRDVLQLLEASLQAEGLQIFVGGESGYEMFGQYSLITAPYSVDGEMVGALGVIGPSRMPYDKLIPIVDITSKLLGDALKKG
jgi:heat-inducible transcriptional repressor